MNFALSCGVSGGNPATAPGGGDFGAGVLVNGVETGAFMPSIEGTGPAKDGRHERFSSDFGTRALETYACG